MEEGLPNRTCLIYKKETLMAVLIPYSAIERGSNPVIPTTDNQFQFLTVRLRA